VTSVCRRESLEAEDPFLEVERLLRADQPRFRKTAETPAEDITIVTGTDGQENQSRELWLEQVRGMIAAEQAAGWTFAILSAGLDAYGEGGRLGHDPRSTQAFAGTEAGARPLGPAHPIHAP
jgi:hypothetical protein